MPIRINLELIRMDEVSDPYAFSTGPQRYLLRWGLGDQREVCIDWDTTLLEDLAKLASGDRTPERLLRMGDRLRDTLDLAGWREQESTIAEALGGGGDVRVLVSSNAAEIYALPWELLRLRSTGEHLYEVHGLQLRYEWPTGFPNTAAELRAALDTGVSVPRVLLAWSDTGGAVPSEAQLEALRAAWPSSALDVLPNTTPSTLRAFLQEALKQGRPVEILQLLAHGTSQGGEVALSLGQAVSPKALSKAIGPFATTLPLVVLSACRGAASAPASRMGHVALALHRGTLRHGGFAAVVGCRSPLSAAGAITLTRALHGALARGRGIDAAVADAREALQLDGFEMDAASLQLYSPRDPAGGASLDPARAALSQQLQRAFEAKEEATLRGESTDIFEVRILELQRALSEGPMLQPGEFLGDGRYRLVEVVGEGGQATVWKAYDRRLQKLVALKVLKAEVARDPDALARFQRGAQEMAALRSAHVVQVLDAPVEEAGRYFFAMELLTGGDLAEDLERHPERPIVETLRRLLGPAQALATAHAEGVVHRDVKPANLLIGESGELLLTDFDLARVEQAARRTRVEGMGTLLFAAPEQLQNARDVDMRADVYSMGMTALWCVARAALSTAAMRDPVAVARSIPASEPVREVLARAVAWDRKDRWPNMEAFIDALEEALEAPAPAQDLGTPSSSAAAVSREASSSGSTHAPTADDVERPQRRAGIGKVAAGVGLLLGIVAIAAMWPGDATPTPPTEYTEPGDVTSTPPTVPTEPEDEIPTPPTVPIEPPTEPTGPNVENPPQPLPPSSTCKDGWVQLSGEVQAASVKEPFLTLDAACRPAKRVTFALPNGGGSARVDVNANGEVFIYSGSTEGPMDLSSVSFPAASASLTTLSRGPEVSKIWDVDQELSLARHDGEVRLTGSVRRSKSNAWPAGHVIATLPAGSCPAHTVTGEAHHSNKLYPVTLRPDCQITIDSAAAYDWLSLEGIRFTPR